MKDHLSDLDAAVARRLKAAKALRTFLGAQNCYDWTEEDWINYEQRKQRAILELRLAEREVNTLMQEKMK